MKKFYFLFLVFLLATFLHVYLPEYMLAAYNMPVKTGPYEKTEEKAQKIYDNLPLTVDLHSDALLWGTDLNHEHKGGMVNIPWLKQARPHLQVFTIVTKVPKKLGFKANSSEDDKLTIPFILSGRNPATWFSLKNRVLEQARRLKKDASQSDGFLKIIETRQDLEDFMTQIRSGKQVAAGMLGIEGLHCLEGKLENLDLFYREGIRMAGPLHLFDNELGGSAQGMNKGGLTDFGKRVVKRMDSLGIVIDLAHASEKAIDDILKISDGPFLTSHTGAKGVCNNGRNLSDRHLKAIAESGGIIGIAFFKPALCKTDFKETAKTMRYVADLVGVEHVALGSDFDGAVSTPTDIRGLHFLVKELLKQGFSKKEIEMIMWKNAVDFWLKNLPDAKD